MNDAAYENILDFGHIAVLFSGSKPDTNNVYRPGLFLLQAHDPGPEDPSEPEEPPMENPPKPGKEPNPKDPDKPDEPPMERPDKEPDEPPHDPKEPVEKKPPKSPKKTPGKRK